MEATGMGAVSYKRGTAVSPLDKHMIWAGAACEAAGGEGEHNDGP